MEANKALMILDVKADKLALKGICGLEEETEEYVEMGSDNSSEDSADDKEKPPNEKDENLRVSLIQSKWVAV
jgi:hypothetical protein